MTITTTIIIMTLSSRLLMSRILSLTFAPPRMASLGLAGASSTWRKASSSRATRKPAALTSKPSPSIDECARCAVPNASLTYTSARLRSEARKAATASGAAVTLAPCASTPLPSSSTWYRRFSSSSTLPWGGSAHAASASGPTQSPMKLTGRARSFSRAAATGASEHSGFRVPSGRPRWEQRTTALAPDSRQYRMLCSAPSILAVLVILLGSALSCGTLKSQRMSTRFPATLTLRSSRLLSSPPAPPPAPMSCSFRYSAMWRSGEDDCAVTASRTASEIMRSMSCFLR